VCPRARCTADGNERRSRDKRIKTKELSADSPFFVRCSLTLGYQHTPTPIPPKKKTQEAMIAKKATPHSITKSIKINIFMKIHVTKNKIY
jgi:hypothetical protein